MASVVIAIVLMRLWDYILCPSWWVSSFIFLLTNEARARGERERDSS